MTILLCHFKKQLKHCKKYSKDFLTQTAKNELNPKGGQQAEGREIQVTGEIEEGKGIKSRERELKLIKGGYER